MDEGIVRKKKPRSSNVMFKLLGRSNTISNRGTTRIAAEAASLQRSIKRPAMVTGLPNSPTLPPTALFRESARARDCLSAHMPTRTHRRFSETRHGTHNAFIAFNIDLIG